MDYNEVAGPALYIGTSGIVSSFKVNSSGQIYHLWKKQLSSRLINHFVIIHCDPESDVLYAGVASYLYALNSKTGDILWEASLKGFFGCMDIKIVGSVVVCGSLGYVYGFSPDGKKLWECDLVGAGYEPITLVPRGNIIYAVTVGYVFAISDNGKILWKNSNEGQGYTGISLAFVSENYMSFGMRGFLRRVNAANGLKMGHSYNLKDAGYRVVSQLMLQNCLYIGTAGIVSAHNPSDFNVIWKNELKGFGSDDGVTLVPYTSSISYTPCILVGLSGYVVCLHAHSGVIQWTFNLPNTFGFVSILVYGETIIAGCTGKLYLINGNTGEKISKDELKGFGYDEMCLVSKHVPMDQQASNLIMSTDIKEKRSE